MPPILLYIEESSVEVVATTRECQDIYRQYLNSKYADDNDGRTVDERKTFINEQVKDQAAPKIYLYTGDNQWKYVAFALRNKNLIIVKGHQWLDRTTWEDQIH